MAILKVARLGHPVLRAKALPVAPADLAGPRIQRLIDDMFETMQEYAGIGLAAPQVHESVRVFVAGLRTAGGRVELVPDGEDAGFLAVVNPEVVAAGPEIQEAWEGCLSIPDVRGSVPRAVEVRLRGFDRDGRRLDLGARGLAARVLQHEQDHLDGILFLDRMEGFRQLAFGEEYSRYWAGDEE